VKPALVAVGLAAPPLVLALLLIDAGSATSTIWRRLPVTLAIGIGLALAGWLAAMGWLVRQRSSAGEVRSLIGVAERIADGERELEVAPPRTPAGRRLAAALEGMADAIMTSQEAAEVAGHPGARVLPERNAQERGDVSPELGVAEARGEVTKHHHRRKERHDPWIAEPENSDPATIGLGWPDEIGQLGPLEPRGLGVRFVLQECGIDRLAPPPDRGEVVEPAAEVEIVSPRCSGASCAPGRSGE